MVHIPRENPPKNLVRDIVFDTGNFGFLFARSGFFMPIQDEGLGGLGVTIINENPFDKILNVFDGRGGPGRIRQVNAISKPGPPNVQNDPGHAPLKPRPHGKSRW
jgi:hypothetical protein